ncbi:MAG: hydrogenase [Deltaproteobacteria bacterium]|jgi:nitrogenase molybdenum-iron protein beta chain|nr:hydrogenase [Deltaproteobacteria bacterium]
MTDLGNFGGDGAGGGLAAEGLRGGGAAFGGHAGFREAEGAAGPAPCLVEKPRHVCALGAQHTVLAIRGAVPIVHAGPGCSSKLSACLNDGAGIQGGGWAGGANVPSTNFTENEVVFGGEAKLRQTVEGTLKVMAGELFVILTGCVPDIVGDDAAGVAREFRAQGHPVASAETGGFKGTNYHGHELALEAIIRDLIPDSRPATRKGLVNVFSGVPFQNPFWRGDLRVLKGLLESLGLRPNILYGQDSLGFAAWKRLPEAEFSLVVTPWADLKAAALVEERWGVPVLHLPEAPIGACQTTKFLRGLGGAAGVSARKLNKVIAFEEERFYDYMVGAAEYLTETRNSVPYRFLVIADSAMAMSLCGFSVNEMGFTPGTVVVTDEPPEGARAKILDFFRGLDGAAVEPVFEPDGGKAAALVENDAAGDPGVMIFASSWERSLAERTDSILLRASLPVYDRLILSKSYLGYQGGLEIMEDLHAMILAKSP